MSTILKIEIRQDRAVYRVPYSMEVIETYPLPPYSTVIGFVHNMLGLREVLEGINVSIQGEYGGVVRDYVRFHKYAQRTNKGKFYPVVVTSLVDVHLIVHLKMPSNEWHLRLLAALNDPPYFPYLGRPEDLITELKVQEVQETPFTSQMSPQGGLRLPFSAYLPVDQARFHELEGIRYLLPGYYQKHRFSQKKSSEKVSLRIFDIIPVLYVQKGSITICDLSVDDQGVPLWWMKS